MIKKNKKIIVNENKNNLSENENRNNINNVLILTTKDSYNNPPKKNNNYIHFKRKKIKRLTAKNPLTISVLNIGQINIKREMNKNQTNARRQTFMIGNIGNIMLQNLNIDSNNYLINNEIKIDEINNSSETKEDVHNNTEQKDLEQKDEKVNKIKLKMMGKYSLIFINANNEVNLAPYNSNYIINNYDYDEAIIYEDRSYFRIFFILLIAKENVLNMIFFNPPL